MLDLDFPANFGVDRLPDYQFLRHADQTLAKID
jgi:hypothetical protein